jgi:ZIP family zinc transporter
MAFAAGAMTFVSLHELFPMARRYGNVQLFLVGLGMSFLAYLALDAMVPQ